MLLARRNSRVTNRMLVMAFLPICCTAQNGGIEPAARKGIDAGNQAWITSMEQAKASIVAATYADNAVDCPVAGDCIKGRPAIEQHLKERSAKLGKAVSASVTSLGSVQQGGLVYEWGRAEATFSDGQKLAGRYLTAWQKQPTGEWKIFRNLAMPGD
jgi:ketosteroid isomerase-like protein